MDRASWLSESLKRFDPRLYCEKNKEGKLCLYRTSKRWESYSLADGSTLTVARPTPFFIFALTDNWRVDGVSVDMGYLRITERLREIDTQNRNLVQAIEENQEKIDKARDRHSKSLIEDGLRERHSKIKKAFSDIRTCNMEKVDRRRRKTKWEL